MNPYGSLNTIQQLGGGTDVDELGAVVDSKDKRVRLYLALRCDGEWLLR